VSVTSEEKLISKLEKSKAYREAYVSEHVKTSVPLQMRHLREQRELTQAQLAELAKTTQTVISRLEDPNYGNLTLNSLLKIASAFDIGLLVKFVPFSRLLLEFQDLSPKALSVKSFIEELEVLKKWASRVNKTTVMPNFDKEIAKGEETHQGVTEQQVLAPPVAFVGRKA
jgi:transcriptional regulator with XRE-family HTH domain